MRERLITILLSVCVTWVVMQATPVRESSADQERTLEVDRLIVRKELIVSDTGSPWEKGFEEQQIPRGIYAKSVTNDSVGGLWVRSRLIKGEIDDPFDDRFHAIERNGSMRRTPGHISWNVFLDGHWRQMAILQGEGLELNEVPLEEWNGGTHPGRIRFQTFRANHSEPMTDAYIGQGKMTLGGGGYGGEGLPYPKEMLELWGGAVVQHPLTPPEAPVVSKDDGSGLHRYAVLAIDPSGRRTKLSPSVEANGLATLTWDNQAGADAFIVVRDGEEITGPLHIEGQKKVWKDQRK